MAWAAQGAARAVLCLVSPVSLQIAARSPGDLITYILHLLTDRAGIGVGLFVVMQIVGMKWISRGLRFFLLFIKVVVFDECRDSELFKIQLVLFAAVTGVGC